MNYNGQDVALYGFPIKDNFPTLIYNGGTTIPITSISYDYAQNGPMYQKPSFHVTTRYPLRGASIGSVVTISGVTNIEDVQGKVLQISDIAGYDVILTVHQHAEKCVSPQGGGTGWYDHKTVNMPNKTISPGTCGYNVAVPNASSVKVNGGCANRGGNALGYYSSRTWGNQY